VSGDITTEAVRLALGMQNMRARVDSLNIANASMTDARVQRMDFAAAQAALDSAVPVDADGTDAMTNLQRADHGLRGLSATTTTEPIQLDAQVADMVSAGADYQALSDMLSRHLGLMRLAVTGKD
jgi:flagellar basal body rod protein FlgB